VQYVLIFSTVQFHSYVTNNLDRGHEKRTGFVRIRIAKSFPQSLPDLGYNPGLLSPIPEYFACKQFFYNTLRPAALEIKQ
jgi:hypothetical protein